MARNDIERVREATDIVELIGSRIQLRKAGRNFKALCPFHQEKTPSFYVFPETQSFYCFGCGASGDALTFLMRLEQLGFREALEQLAERAGITLSSSGRRGDSDSETTTHLLELNRLAASWFQHVLWSTTVGEPARQYLERRGITRDIAELFSLGYAPDTPTGLSYYLLHHGATTEELIEVGLAIRRDDGRVIDRFRHRLLFPIRDRRGRIIGFGGRTLGDAQPKYLNSPQTILFDKSSVLYALDQAAEAIRRERTVIVVEGYFDAITAHQYGYRNTVASLGTALTEKQARQLRQLADHIVLALDADLAGKEATLRGLEVLRTTLADRERPVADPRQLIRFERTLGVELAVVVLPEGEDPDEVIRRDQRVWEQALANARPLIDYYLDILLSTTTPKSPRAATQLVQRIAPLLLELGDPVLVDLYTRTVARRLGLSEETVRRVLTLSRQGGARPQKSVGQPPPLSQPLTTEQHCVALVVRYPDVASQLTAELTDAPFVGAQHREIINLLLKKGTLHPEDLPEDLREYVLTLSQRVTDQPDLPFPLARQALLDALRRLRRERHDGQLRSLLAEIQAAEATGDQETLRSTLELVETLKQRFPEFYPQPSPYFRDTRDPLI